MPSWLDLLAPKPCSCDGVLGQWARRRAQAIAAMAMCYLPSCEAPVPEVSESALASITAEDVSSSIGILSHDSMQGRATGSAELAGVAVWIAGAFRAAGLAPMAPDREYVNRYVACPKNNPAASSGCAGLPAEANASNVVGVLIGSHPTLRREHLMVTAHMDHLGLGSDGLVYNGADDNASGVAVLLELAEAFGQTATRPRRSIALAALSGEEIGLLGSRCLMSRTQEWGIEVVANVNVDMVGRNAADSLVVVGYRYSDLGPHLLRVNRRYPELGLTLDSDPSFDRFFSRSDQFSFAIAGVPAVFVFGGLHQDYHRPTDDHDRINLDKTTRVAKLLFLYLNSVANVTAAPRWDDAQTPMANGSPSSRGQAGPGAAGRPC